MDNKFKMPTEIVELPSQGLIYPESSPLSSGKVEMKYMTAREEDILTNQNYISKGTVLDELVKSLIVSDIDYGDLIVGDKNAVLVAARILGYGKDYTFNYKGEEVTVDLSQLDNKPFNEKEFNQGKNEFTFKLPNSGNTITFKLLTHGDESAIEAEIKGLQKINKNASPELSTRLKYIILSINGDYDKKSIREFVDNEFLAMDSREFRKHIKQTQPDVDLSVTIETTNGMEDVEIPINLNFFWPDASI